MRGEITNKPVPAPPEVIEGIERIRESGRTNMADRNMVQVIANEMNLYRTVTWLEDNPNLYREGLFNGFTAEEGA